ncbi:MAG: hypothetical protein IPM43_12285 [Actinomycetota bacterium]|nr:MAG: hypothetical protein IPM43_12285 [Actinomycetota bacterium]
MSPSPSPPAIGMRSRVRAVLAGVVAVIAVIGVLASVVSIWASRVIFDSSATVKAADAALDDPAVTAGLAAFITDEIFGLVDPQATLDDKLPENLGFLAPAIVGGARNFVQNEVDSLISSEPVREVMLVAVERAHGAFVRLVEGDGLVDGFTVTDGEVSIDLTPLLARGLLAVQNIGLLDDVDVPDLDRSDSSAENIAALEEAFGKTLSPEFGQLVVYRSDALADAQGSIVAAQRAVVLMRRAIVAILIITAVCLVGAVALARRRRRMVIGLVLASSVAMLVVSAVVKRIVRDSPTLVLKPGARAAIHDVTTTLASSLYSLVLVTILVGAIIALVAWLTGGGERVKALRANASDSGGSLLSIVSAHSDAVALVAFAAAALLLVVAGIHLGTLVVALLLAAVGAWALLRDGAGTAPAPATTTPNAPAVVKDEPVASPE